MTDEALQCTHRHIRLALLHQLNTFNSAAYPQWDQKLTVACNYYSHTVRLHAKWMAA